MGIELSNPILQNSEPVQKFLAYLALYGVVLVLFRHFVWPFIAVILESRTLQHTLRFFLLRFLYMLFGLLLLAIAFVSLLTITGGEITLEVRPLPLPDIRSSLAQIDVRAALSAAVLFLAVLILWRRVRSTRQGRGEGS